MHNLWTLVLNSSVFGRFGSELQHIVTMLIDFLKKFWNLEAGLKNAENVFSTFHKSNNYASKSESNRMKSYKDCTSIESRGTIYQQIWLRNLVLYNIQNG